MFVNTLVKAPLIDKGAEITENAVGRPCDLSSLFVGMWLKWVRRERKHVTFFCFRGDVTKVKRVFTFCQLFRWQRWVWIIRTTFLSQLRRKQWVKPSFWLGSNALYANGSWASWSSEPYGYRRKEAVVVDTIIQPKTRAKIDYHNSIVIKLITDWANPNKVI